jgi:hypothetical protein
MKQAANRAEDTNLRICRCENLKSNIKNCFLFDFTLHNVIYYMSYCIYIYIYIRIYLMDFLQLQICFTPLMPHYSDSDDMASPEVIKFVVKQTSDMVTMSIFVK